jgi:hypothetical protein
MQEAQAPRKYLVVERGDGVSTVHRASDMAWCAVDRGYEDTDGSRVVLGTIIFIHHEDALRLADALENGTQSISVAWLSGPEAEAGPWVPPEGDAEFGVHSDGPL